MEKVKHKERREEDTSIEDDIPTAPTIEDFYYDPGIRERLDPGETNVPPLETDAELSESLCKITGGK